MAPPPSRRLPSAYALDHILDHQGDVTAHAAGAHDEQEATDRTDRGDQGQCHHDPVQATDRIGDGSEDDRTGEAPEDKGVDAEHGKTDRAHFGRCSGRQGQEDADGERRDRGVGQELSVTHSQSWDT